MAVSIDFTGWVKIFRTGRHTDSAGQPNAWTEADLDTIVQNYDPAQYQAPIVLGHPSSDDPAWGWVSALKRTGDTLYAKFEQIVPEFAEMIRKGLYSNRSVALDYTDQGWWLRHVGFLGAVPPAVKGLNASAALAMPITSVVEFHEPFKAEVLGSILQRLREWIIGRDGIDEADRVLPSSDVDLLRIPEPEIIEVPVPVPIEPEERMPFMEQKETVVTIEMMKAEMDKAVQVALAQQRTALEAEFAADRAAQQTRLAHLETERRTERVTSFVDGLIKEGRVTPAMKAAGLVEFACALEASSTSVHFAGAGDPAHPVEQAASQWFAQFLSTLPKHVPFGEFARADYHQASVSSDPGYAYMTRVKELQKTDNLTFTQAEAMIQATTPELYDAYFAARQRPVDAR